MGRKERMQDVLTILREHEGKMPFQKLFGAMSEKHSITKNTFWSYLEALKASKKIDYPIAHRLSINGKEVFEISIIEKA